MYSRCVWQVNVCYAITITILFTALNLCTLSKSILCLRYFTNKFALDTARGIIPMKIFHLVQFNTVFIVMEVIRFIRALVRKIRALLCRLPDISSFLYYVRKSNPVACYGERQRGWLCERKFFFKIKYLLHCTLTCSSKKLTKKIHKKKIPAFHSVNENSIWLKTNRSIHTCFIFWNNHTGNTTLRIFFFQYLHFLSFNRDTSNKVI